MNFLKRNIFKPNLSGKSMIPGNLTASSGVVRDTGLQSLPLNKSIWLNGVDEVMICIDIPAFDWRAGCTLMVRFLAPKIPPSQTSMFITIGDSAQQFAVGIRTNGQIYAGRTAADNSTWVGIGGDPNLVSNNWKTLIIRSWADGGQQEYIADIYEQGGVGRSSRPHTSTAQIPVFTTDRIGLGAKIVNNFPPFFMFTSLRVSDLAFWDTLLTDDQVEDALNEGKGAELGRLAPPLWWPNILAENNENSGSFTGPSQEGDLLPRPGFEPMTVDDGPDRFPSGPVPLYLSAVQNQSIGVGANEVLQGLDVTDVASFGSGPGAGVGSKRLHKYNDGLFDNDPPAAFLNVVDAAVTQAASTAVDHLGDVSFIPNNGAIDAGLRDAIVCPMLRGTPGGDGVLSLVDPTTFLVTSAFKTGGPSGGFGAAYSFLGSACYFFFDEGYGSSTEGVLACGSARIFVTDIQAGVPALLRDYNAINSFELVEGVIQLTNSNVLMHVAFSTNPNVPNGLYEADFYLSNRIRLLRRWELDLPPVGHFEGISVNAAGTGVWQGEGSAAVEYLLENFSLKPMRSTW